MMKSSPAAKMDGGRSLGCSTSAAITSRKIPVPSMSSPPSKLHHPPSALVSHGTVDAPPVITPVPLTKRSDSRAETCTVATEGRRIVSSYEQPRSPVHVSAAHVNSRRVTLEVGGTSKDCESSKISSVTKNFAIVEVTQKQGAQIASPLDKTNGTMSANLQGDYERAINHTGISEDGPSDVLIIASENVSMGGVTVEPNNVDSAVGSFEEMYQSIMSKNLQFEDGWKYFQDKILDLSGELSMKHGDILAIEQSALNLKREMGQKLEALLHQVEF